MPQNLKKTVQSLSAVDERDKSAGVNISFILLFGVLILSRVLGRTHQSLWFDEGFTVALGSASSFHNFWIRFGQFTTSEHLQPLYYVLIFLWSRLAGTSDASLRLLSSIFSIGSGIAAYHASSTLAGSRRLFVLLSFAGITVSSFSLYYGQEARPYALLQMVSFLVLSTWLNSSAKKGAVATLGSSQFALAIACSLCLLSSVFTTLLVICLAFSELIIRKDFDEWIHRWSLSIGISITVYLAYLVPAVLTMPSFVAHDITGIHQPLWMNIGYSLYGIIFGPTLPPAISSLRGPDKIHVALSFWPILLTAFLTVGSLVVGLTMVDRSIKNANPNIRIILTTLLIYIVLFFGFFGGVGHLNVLPRHSSGLFAIIFIAVIACASQLSLQVSPVASFILKCGVAGYFILNLFSLYGYYCNPVFQKDDYRGTAKLINSYSEPVFLVAGDPLLLARYGAQTKDATTIDPSNLSKFIQAEAPGATGIKLIFNEYRNFRWGSDHSVASVMKPLYKCGIEKQLADFQIYACEKRE